MDDSRVELIHVQIGIAVMCLSLAAGVALLWARLGLIKVLIAAAALGYLAQAAALTG